ncbi:MAG: HDIG domain-containing protein [Planctomycetaceae bacterium]|nr:HDIG domain-containing protein [Planctomycetaceae bacterium]
MFFGWRKRRRFERVASLELPPGQWERAWIGLRRRDVTGRIGLALLASVALSVVAHAWAPAFPYRTGYTPSRDIVAAVAFVKPDPAATEDARQRAADQVPRVYVQDPAPLVQLRARLRVVLSELTAAPTLDKLDPKIWKAFQPPLAEGAKAPDAKKQAEQFRDFRAAFTPQENLERMSDAIADVFKQFEDRGLLLPKDLPSGKENQKEITIYPVGHPEAKRVVQVGDVLLGDGTAIRDALRKTPELSSVADALFAWIQPQLHPTLTLDPMATKLAVDEAVRAVPDVLVEYSVGQRLSRPDHPLDDEQMELLQLEYAAALQSRSIPLRLARFLAVTAMIFGAMLLCGIYMRYRQRGPLASLTRLVVLLMMAVATVALARWASADAWRGELVPVLLFGMIMTIVYRQELALLLTGIVAMIVVLAVGHGLQEFLLLMCTSAAAILSLGSIRHRSKLIYVGLFAGAVATVLYVAIGLVDDQPMGVSLFREGLRNGLWALAAGFLATGLLPFIEQLFGVLTDLSLLELGDIAHPLLQELVRRAPSTYNHSITVGSIAEAAAESIHARGLLVRVGAYFHDIGKMLKPGYFIENQGPDDNRHETLVPAMSTLVIIAHIKDGADLARQHRLPQPIIDLIVQHHGTTRVEFFFGRATEQQQANPNASEVDESSFRYPGPKPQTKEAAVLMLADAVESASRTLVDPTPARIESLVREIAEKRLHDNQFDESGLTLRELRTIEKSMVMSLTSIYHGRIKYPEQRTA